MNTTTLLTIGTGLLTIATIVYDYYTNRAKKRKALRKRPNFILDVPKLKKNETGN
jgi:hypothetical protein